MKKLRSILSRITGISTPLGGISWSANDDERNPDLIISSLEGICGLTPLDGHPVISRNGKQIFTGGVRTEFILTHNNCGDSKILLKRIGINVVKYEDGENEDLSYQIQGDEISGAGLLKPEQFYVSLFGKKVGYAKWVRSDGSCVESKNYKNLLDTNDLKYITLQAKSDDTIPMLINISAQEVGSYELSFTFDYMVEGKERSKTTADTICLYYER